MEIPSPSRWRLVVVFFVFFILFSVIVWRLVDLTVIDQAFLRNQGQARSMRIVPIPAYRGMILDRNSEPLAISTPVFSLWVNPQSYQSNYKHDSALRKLMGMELREFDSKISKRNNREFVYLKRQVSPEIATQVKAMDIPGVYLQQEFRRYYPQGKVGAHLLGFTNIDDRGQEGLELEYDDWLQGISGKKYVLKDRMGNAIADLNKIRDPHPGRNLTLTIDQRIQYLAFHEMEVAMEQFKAQSASAVVLDAKTGEVLAMANLPTYNPNHRSHDSLSNLRNRAMTDQFEPGSVIKPFSIACALEAGHYKPDSIIDTTPGWMVLNGSTIRDEHNIGKATLTEVLKHSSNVGISKMILTTQPDSLYTFLNKLGFGQITAINFPGEASGVVTAHTTWRPFTLATLAFGYGISVTPIQLAQAYNVFANHGDLIPVSLVHSDQKPAVQHVLDAKVSDTVLQMMQQVVSESGTGKSAQLAGYSIAGKTGTARMAAPRGYDKHRHIASFVGILPVSDPKLVIAVVIIDPQANGYHAAEVAAPAFAHIAAGTLRILDIPPDIPSAVNTAALTTSMLRK